ncbi:Dot/Icm T4SS effector Ceg23 [Legionella sp.]|uniref:Dot/Icm T4SS effector Ceg23 n=1 Tax=Legionella sp. TaxID=459 RepID=UPI003C9DA601
MLKKLFLRGREIEVLDVSGAFDNCFFHTYVTYLIAHQLPLPEGLFTFKSILGSNSYALQLQKRFPNIDSLSLFSDFSKSQKPDKKLISPNFIVEKTLILGFLLREWFATQMAKHSEIGEAIKNNILTQFINYKNFRAFVAKEDLLSGPEGVIYSANQDFLEYFYAYPKAGKLTQQEQVFNNYFTENDGDIHKALTAYWHAQGYQNYCRQFATSTTKLAYNDLSPIVQFIGQPITIYDEHGGILQDIKIEEKTSTMEIVLYAAEGHYGLLNTNNVNPLLNEYHKSFKQYKKDREQILAAVENKLVATNTKPSLLVAAICPSEHLDDPFALLLDKVDFMRECVMNVCIIDSTLKRINSTLIKLKGKIGRVDQHYFPEAAQKANELLKSLEEARDKYKIALNQSDANANQQFQEDCERSINAAKPVLERDLSWDDYLANLLKALVNAVMGLISLKKVNLFFTPLKPASFEAVEEAKKVLIRRK